MIFSNSHFCVTCLSLACWPDWKLGRALNLGLKQHVCCTEGGCLLAHSWVWELCFIFPSLASGMEKFERRCNAEQHQEPEKCWCCSEGVDVVEMVSVVLGPTAKRDSGVSCLREPGCGCDLAARPAWPLPYCKVLFTDTSQPVYQKSCLKKGRSLYQEKGEDVLVSFQLQGTLSLISP